MTYPLTNLNKRRLDPASDDIIYHYCSAEAFLAICQTRSIRFGDLTHMNDAEERVWGYEKVWPTVKEALRTSLGDEFVTRVQELITEAHDYIVPLGACFSMARDTLSQWRGYAGEDTEGYAIGFSAERLRDMAATQLLVLYDRDRQEEELTQVLLDLHAAEENASEPYGDAFHAASFGLQLLFSAYKNPAFAEEKEVRLVHALTRPNHLRDPGGTAFAKPAAEQPIPFRIANGGPSAYLDLDFSNQGKANPIREVILGPRNRATIESTSTFLKTIELIGVSVTRSSASYR